MIFPNVFEKNDAKSGFNGGSFFKYPYKLFNNSSLSTSLSFIEGTSQLNSSQAMLGYLNRIESSASSGGSSIIKVTNCFKISGLVKLKQC